VDADKTIDFPLSGVICEDRFFSAFYTDSPVAACLCDNTGRFVDVNHKCAELWGYSRGELIGMPFQEVTFHDDIIHDMRMVNRMLEGKEEYYTMVKRYVCKGGDVIWARLYARAVRNAEGKIEYFVGHIIPMDSATVASMAFSVSDLLKDPKARFYVRLIGVVLILLSVGSLISMLHILGIMPMVGNK
jgi:PAS domain S-box-containing protein